MTDKNINLCDTEDEKLRYNASIFPSLIFLRKGLPEGKALMRKLTKELSKIPSAVGGSPPSSFISSFFTYLTKH